MCRSGFANTRLPLENDSSVLGSSLATDLEEVWGESGWVECPSWHQLRPLGQVRVSHGTCGV